MTEQDPVSAVPNEGYDPRVRGFRCGDTVDSFALLTERYVVLVDTMVNLETMGAVMDLLAPALTPDRPLLVINTHGDWDHVWGNGIFAGPDARYPAPIIGSALTAQAMASPPAVGFLTSFQAEHPGRYDSARFVPPTIQFEGTLQIDCGDLTLQLISTPGHKPDHMAVWVPELHLLFAGDAAELPFPLVGEPDDLPTLRATLRRMLDLGPETVLYCHAPGLTSPSLIAHNIWYFDELEHRCRDLLAGTDLPPNLTTIDDPATLLNWPLEATLPPGTALADLQPPGFYDKGHARAIRAMLQWLRSHSEGGKT